MEGQADRQRKAWWDTRVNHNDRSPTLADYWPQQVRILPAALDSPERRAEGERGGDPGGNSTSAVLSGAGESGEVEGRVPLARIVPHAREGRQEVKAWRT